MSLLNNFILENKKERNHNDLFLYEANSNVVLEVPLKEISDFRFDVHKKFSNMILYDLNNIISATVFDKEMLNKVSDYDFNNLNLYVTNLEEEHIKTINCKYVINYCRLIEKAINDAINDKLDDRVIFELIDDNAVYRLEKQAVVGAVKYGKDIRAVKDSLSYSQIKVDNDYFDRCVVPFINKFKKKQNECNLIHSEWNKTIDILQKFVVKLLALMNENIDNKINNYKKVHKIIVKSLRVIDKVTGFVTFCVMLNTQELINKALSIQTLYNDLINSNIIATEEFNGNIIFPTDTHSLAEDMLNGKCGAYEELVNHIYSFYTMKNKIDNEFVLSDMDNQEKNYDNTPYKNIINSIGTISKGLDNIGKEGDEYLMMFDNVLDETGLNLPLLQKYKNDLELLANPSESDTPMLDTDLIDRKIYELIGFKKNVESLTEMVYDTYKKIRILIDRFSENINNEYKDIDTINKYKIFLTDFITTYSDYIESVCGALISRLNSINSTLEKATMDLKPNYSVPLINDSQLTAESFNFQDIVFNESYNSLELNFIALFEKAERNYIVKKRFKDRGVKLIIEADENNNAGNKPTENNQTPNNNSTNQPANNTNNQQDNGNNQDKNATKPTIQDGDKTKGNQKDAGTNKEAIKGKLSTVIQKLMNMLNNVIEKFALKHMKFIADNKTGLSNRSYANVTVTMLPYHNFDTGNFSKDLVSLSTNISSLTNDSLNTMNTIDDMYKKLFSFINGGDVLQNNIDTRLTNYYKIGNAPVEKVEVANGNLKNIIVSSMIPYCEEYGKKDGGFKDKLKQDLDKFVNSANTSISKLVDSDTDNKNGEKIGWISEAVQHCVAAMMSASRDRFLDYYKILFSLAPKGPITPNQNNQNNNNQTDNNQNNNQQPQNTTNNNQNQGNNNTNQNQ